MDITSANLLSKIIDSERVGNYINGMRWISCIARGLTHNLLTSDRPVVMSNGINRDDSFIIAPISPCQFFLAVNCDSKENYLKKYRYKN